MYVAMFLLQSGSTGLEDWVNRRPRGRLSAAAAIQFRDEAEVFKEVTNHLAGQLPLA